MTRELPQSVAFYSRYRSFTGELLERVLINDDDEWRKCYEFILPQSPMEAQELLWQLGEWSLDAWVCAERLSGGYPRNAAVYVDAEQLAATLESYGML
jgi:hypothetical protein